jgi:putative MATE family efflux protein
MKNKREELLTENMGKLFIKMAIPGMIGMTVIGLYNLVDSIFVGQFVGPAAVSAVTMGYAIVLVNQALLSLFATGAASLFSRAMGANDRDTIDALLGNIFWPVLICSTLLSVCTYTFASQILTRLGAQGEILSLGVQYLKILSLGFVFGGLGPALNFLIRGEGHMKKAMQIMALGTFTNIILDYVFIKVFAMGMTGAALATIIGQALIVVGNFLHFASPQSLVCIRPHNFRMTLKYMPDILKIGFSGMVMSLAVAVQLSILLAMSARYSVASNIVMSTGFRVMAFFYIPVFGISYGLQPVVGANYGAKLYDRVKRSFWFFGRIAFAITFVLWVFFQSCAPFILSWFITDRTIVEQGVGHFRLFLSSFFLYGFMMVIIMLFMALGKAKKGAFMTLGRQILFFIPLVYVLPRWFGEIGVWLSYPLGDLFIMLFGSVILFKELRALDALHTQEVYNKERTPELSREEALA